MNETKIHTAHCHCGAVEIALSNLPEYMQIVIVVYAKKVAAFGDITAHPMLWCAGKPTLINAVTCQRQPYNCIFALYVAQPLIGA